MLTREQDRRSPTEDPLRTGQDDPQHGATLRDLDLGAHLTDPTIKQRFVTRMFDIIAPRYDRFTRVFSYGMDRGWKRELLSYLAATVPGDGHVVDLACGTGDLSFAAARVVPEGRVTGLDVSARMIEAAEERRMHLGADRVRFSTGDMMSLSLADESADAVTAGYAFRNVPEVGAALDEAVRVLKPGGRLFVLDFYRPRNPIWRTLFLWYLRVAGNVIGWLWHREGAVYGYIAPSIATFVSWQDFGEALGHRGMTVERSSPKVLGGVCLHVARKGDSSIIRRQPLEGAGR